MSNPLFAEPATDSNENEHYGHLAKNRAQLLISDWKYVVDQDLMADERLVGQEMIQEDQGVDSKHIPNIVPEFGIMGVRVYTRGDAHNNRLSHISLNTDDLFNRRKVERFTELGGVNVNTVGYIVNALSGTLTPDPDTLVTVRSTIEHIDRAHAYKESSFVQRWAELKETIAKSPETGGRRYQITRQRVDPLSPLPSGPTIIDVKLEEETEKRALLTVTKAPDGFGKLTHWDMRYADRQGLKVVTFEEIVDLETYYADLYNSLDFSSDSVYVGQRHPYILEWKVEDLGNGKGKVTRVQIPYGFGDGDTGWPELLSGETEPETKAIISTTQFVYQRPSAFASTYFGLPALTSLGSLTTFQDWIAQDVPSGWEYSFRAIDALRCLVTLRHVNDDYLTSTTFEEYHSVKYYFPARLDASTPFTISNVTAAGGTRSVVSTNRTSDYSLFITCRFEITFHTTQPTPDEIFQFIPVDISINTPDWTMEERDILTNGGTLVIYYGASSYSFDIAESTPSVDDFIDMIGDEVLISDESEKWRYGLWKRIKVYMTVPAL